MSCCSSCDSGLPCESRFGTNAAPLIAQAMREHNQTAPRYAQMMIGLDAQNPDAYLWRKQLGALGQLDPATAADCASRGMVLDMQTMECVDPFAPPAPGEDPVPPGGGFPGFPGAPIPGSPAPGGGLVVTEQQCKAREASAREAGRKEESGKLWKAAAVSAVVSLTLGYAFARVMR